MDILPPIVSPKAEIFIKTIEAEEIDWCLFLDSFTINVWLILLTMAMIISLVLTFIEGIFGSNAKQNRNYWTEMLRKSVGNLWFAFKANFGGGSDSVHRNFSHKIVIHENMHEGEKLLT